MKGRIAFLILPVSAGILNVPQIQAQSAHPEFEVASIKLSAGGLVSLGTKSPGTFFAANHSVAGLLMAAYGVRAFQIQDGPGHGWIRSVKYDVLAKYKADSTGNGQSTEKEWADIDIMLQALLEDRFQMKVHRETKTLPVYALTVAKSGLKLHPANCITQPAAGEKPLNICESRYGNKGLNRTLDWTGTNMADLTRFALPNIMGRTVIDKTGLQGSFDIHLEWTPDQATEGITGSQSPGNPGGPAPLGDATAISIFTAFQEQLGLKLESDKGPVEVIVIDHVERPSSN